MTLGERIKQFRIEAGMNQEELAAACGVTRFALSNYERDGRVPTVETFQKMAAALHTSMDELAGYTPEKLAPLQIAIRDIEISGFSVGKQQKEGELSGKYFVGWGKKTSNAFEYSFWATQKDLLSAYKQIQQDSVEELSKVKHNLYADLFTKMEVEGLRQRMKELAERQYNK